MRTPRETSWELNNSSKRGIKAVSGRIRLPFLATAAGAKRSQIVVSVDSSAVTIVPSEFDGVVTHGTDLL